MSQDSQESKGKMLTTVDAAREISVSDETIRAWIKVGFRGRKLKASRYGRQFRIAPNEWAAFKSYLDSDPLTADQEDAEAGTGQP